MKKNVSVFIMDVDGTLTDGRIHISSTGELFKSFHVADGYGIHNILPAYGIVPVIITGRTSEIVARRAEELGIQQLHQGVKDKVRCIKKVAIDLDVPLERMACIGDDLNDLPMMRLCGVRGCPSNATAAVQQTCDYVCKAAGGYGAVREFIDWIISNNPHNQKTIGC